MYELHSLARALATLALITAPIWGSARAAEPLVTDRPDQTESATLVQPGRYQLETGWLWSNNDDDGVDTETRELGGSLLRIGLDHFELRIGWDGLIDQDVETGGGSTTVDGPGDAEIGAKLHLFEEKDRRPEIALLVGATVPIGDDDVSSNRVDPSFRLSLAHTLTDRIGIGYNAGMAWSSEPDSGGERDTLSRFVYTVATGIGINDRLSAFVELFGEAGGSAGGSPSNSLDGGITYLVRDNIQLDASAGLGLSDAADDWFLSAGVPGNRAPDWQAN